MAKETIAVGTSANDGSGDPLRDAMIKVNSNFTELYDKDADFIPSIASTGYSGNATATVISVATTYYVVAGTLVESYTSSDMTTDAAGKITYTGTVDKHFHIVSNFDMTSASSNQIISFQWFKNGSTAISPPVKRKIGTGSDIGAASLHADAMLSQNDYLELKVTNDTSATNVTVQNLYLFAWGSITS